MSAKGTEKTLTVDANVIHYHIMFLLNHPLPQGCRTRRIREFCFEVMKKHSIAINKYIKTEYIETSGLEAIQHWIKQRNKNSEPVIEVRCVRLTPQVANCLRDNYYFNCNSKDMRYLQTCKNTIFKKLITQNIEHFFLSHKRGPRRGTMDSYLKRKEGICIHTIDDCCSILLDD